MAWQLRIEQEHLHEPDQQLIECIALKAGVKRKARDTNDTTHHIIGHSLDPATESSVIKLPKLDSMKRTIRRERHIIDAAPGQLESLDVIPQEYQITAKGENFLLYDSGTNTQRMIIFGTQRNVEMLNAFHIYLADGTFKNAPSLFSQV